MVTRRSQQYTTERWNGLWGADARYYARRSDGACFAIDGTATVFDLAGSSLPTSQARRVSCLPHAGRYTLTVCAMRPVDGAEASVPADTVAPREQRPAARVFAYGVRRRTR